MKFSVVKSRLVWYVLSGVMIGVSIFAFAAFGLKQGIEFTGGTLMAVRFEQDRPSAADASDILSKAVTDLGSITAQPAGDKDIQFRYKTVTEEQHQSLLKSLNEKYGKVEELRFDAIGPVIGEELRKKSIQGLLIVLLAILAYIAYAFRRVTAPVPSWQYGLVTVFTAFHDVIVPIGVFSLLGHFAGWEIGTPFVAAVLTIMGYSIQDTIVVLDRVRENLTRSDVTFSELVDLSVRQTFLRSFNTSMTTLLALTAIFIFGGSSLHEFTLALILGISVGTYSSIFIASPMLVTIDKTKRRFAK
ncbi:MAG: protein translocase subunit SecF [Candidatus Uhrbacteria bacterium]